MGFSHAVNVATDSAVELPRSVASPGAFSVNVKKEQALAESSLGLYLGASIDNIFALSENDELANKAQEKLSEVLQARGLVRSENSPAKARRKLLGAVADGGDERPGQRPPPGLEDGIHTVSIS